MKYLPLTQGQQAIVDDADFEWLNQWKWCAFWDPSTSSFRAGRGVRVDGKHKTIYMHRMILGLTGDTKTDHKNHNTLDNRRDNLRPANDAQSTANRRMPKHNTHGVKGISWGVRQNKWQARIRIRGKLISLGYFKTPEEAHEAYKKKVLEVHGEFAYPDSNGVEK